MQIVKLTDSYISDIQTDLDCLSRGCETCGYGSDYCTTVKIYFGDSWSDKICAEYHNSYSFSESFSIGYFVRMFCNNIEAIQNMSKDEFQKWFMKTVENDFSGVKFYA